MWYWFFVIGCGITAAMLLGGCAADPDPRGQWVMEEWSSVRAEGGAFHASKRRAWGERLSP